VDPIVLEGNFRVRRYGLGHSRLVMHAGPIDSRPDAVSVEFNGVTAVKLRRSYPGLTLRLADEPTRTRLLDFADIPHNSRHDPRPTQLCFTLPTEDDGFVVCGQVKVLVGRQPRNTPDWQWPEGMTVLHRLTGGPPTD
jgi:hypothetical protein